MPKQRAFTLAAQLAAGGNCEKGVVKSLVPSGDGGLKLPVSTWATYGANTRVGGKIISPEWDRNGIGSRRLGGIGDGVR